MPKGVAIPYIIALILGIVVIGLLGYWFFVLGGQAGGTGTAQICNAKQAAWCQQWSISGFSGNCPLTQQPCEATSDADARWSKFAQGCDATPHDKPTCQAIFGQGAANLPTQSSSTSSTSSTSTSSGGATCNPPCDASQGYRCVNGQCRG